MGGYDSQWHCLLLWEPMSSHIRVKPKSLPHAQIGLTQWTDNENLESKCRNVLKWAVPAKEEESDDGPTDELGMSQKDREEKEEWQAKRKAVRGDAIERIKMKEADRKKEEDRVALEDFKTNDPEGYATMIQ